MRKKEAIKKLSFNKETVANLTNEQLLKLKGGQKLGWTGEFFCGTDGSCTGGECNSGEVFWCTWDSRC